MTWFADWMWQGCLLAAFAALGLCVAGRVGAATRHLLWGGVLGAVVLLPLARAALSTSGDPTGTVPTLMAAPAAMIVPSPPSLLVGLALALWIAITLVLLARVARDVVAIGRLQRDSTPLSPEYVARLPLWNARPPGGRAVALRVSAHLAVPCALGLGRATVLLPRPLLEALSDDELDQIVMHEYGHLARRDDWWQLAQAIVSAVAVPHPAVHWICRQLDFEREAACDEWVVACTNAPRRYAKCLVDVAASVCPPPAAVSHPPGLAPGATRAGRALLRRVRRLVDGTHRPGRRPRLAATTTGGLAVAVATTVLAGMAPVVVFRDLVSGLPRVDARPLEVANAALTVLPAGGIAAAPDKRPRPTAWTSVDTPRPPDSRSPARDAAGEAAVTPSAAPPLLARQVAATQGEPPFVPPPGLPTAGQGPWQRVAAAGSAIGDASKQAGLATAGFFERAGRGLGGAFNWRTAGQ